MRYILIVLLLFALLPVDAQKPNKEDLYKGLTLRSIGPAFASGRIADIAIHPKDENIWYVAVGSGGVWKTVNAGVTWDPIFDNQSVYSTGCITIDPNNPNVIWLGTGENVGGRHVGFGDGIYKSADEGKSWTNMGLKSSEHISEIIIHPENSDVLFVAVQGPLWSKGGERGLYKSIDGGKNWRKTLGGNEWTGVTDIAMDPRDSNTMYAATWQRHRTIAAYMGGGPDSGIHKSTDGGENWTELTNGIPTSNLGKIGLAISPHNPDIIYAAIELDRTKGGVYASTNNGATWKKRSNAVSGATGPHYYQELYVSPHVPGRLYLMDNNVQISEDGGYSFKRLNERGKHSDNHEIVFKKNDPDYIMLGSDGGIYESFDHAKTWRFINNMPITQYYKVAVDDKQPFYHVYGGTQDNGSHGGPSRTDNVHGIRNADWYKTLGADGHQSATEPGNPNILYAETQQGGLHRIDKITGEQVYVQPQPGAGEDYERFNWDAPIVVSNHDPARLYFASQRVWRSNDRGDSWTTISEDLTKDQERITLPIMGKKQSWDNPWDVGAMSNFNTISSLSESPRDPNLIYAGTDDGIIQVTANGGQNWRKIEVNRLPGVPANAFVNDIKADMHDVNTVYVALDNHKEGDFKPYLFKSTNQGNTWTSISNNLPKKTLVWRIVQDHIAPNLLFAATEFGVYFSLNSGSKWEKLKGAPTISFRDLVIQKRANDLVCASFGRGFYILDDYSFLREVNNDVFQKDGALFTVKDADWYVPRSIVSSQGSQQYAAKNPSFGAVFTYFIKDGFTSQKKLRQKKEKEMKDQNVSFPGWDALASEEEEVADKTWLVVKDIFGQIVRKIEAKNSKGIHRTNWDLRRSSNSTIRLNSNQSGGSRWRRGGFMAPPGLYTVTLMKQTKDELITLDGPKPFKVVPLYEGTLKGSTAEEFEAVRLKVEKLQAEISSTSFELDQSIKKVNAMEVAVSRSNIEPGVLEKDIATVKKDLRALHHAMNGNPAKSEIGERNNPTPRSRMFVGMRGLRTTYGPTPNHIKSVDIGLDEIAAIGKKLNMITSDILPKIEKALQKAGAPYIEGMSLHKN